jgi:uncharacterized protein YhdP
LKCKFIDVDSLIEIKLSSSFIGLAVSLPPPLRKKARIKYQSHVEMVVRSNGVTTDYQEQVRTLSDYAPLFLRIGLWSFSISQIPL